MKRNTDDAGRRSRVFHERDIYWQLRCDDTMFSLELMRLLVFIYCEYTPKRSVPIDTWNRIRAFSFASFRCFTFSAVISLAEVVAAATVASSPVCQRPSLVLSAVIARREQLLLLFSLVVRWLVEQQHCYRRRLAACPTARYASEEYVVHVDCVSPWCVHGEPQLDPRAFSCVVLQLSSCE